MNALKNIVIYTYVFCSLFNYRIDLSKIDFFDKISFFDSFKKTKKNKYFSHLYHLIYMCVIGKNRSQ